MANKTPAVSILGPRSLIVAAFLVLGVVLYFYLRQPPPIPPQPVLTPEAKAYVRNLQLSDTEKKAITSYMNQKVIEITGNITNNGDRTLKLVEINCVFYDIYGQLVLRERVPIVRSTTGGLKPGETKPFRLPFDSVPDSWNQAMPQMVIAQIQFL